MQKYHKAHETVSFVESFFKTVDPKNSDPLFVIKSTVPIGTTERMCRIRDDLRIVHNPEFLTAVNAVEDFRNSDRNIIGGFQKWCLELRNLYTEHFPYTQIQIVKSRESETIKYFCICILELNLVTKSFFFFMKCLLLKSNNSYFK